MRYLKMDEEEFWANPERLKKIGFPGTILKSDDEVELSAEERQHRSRSSYFVLGNVEDDSSPAGIVLHLPPGYGLPFHAHSCDIFMLVLKGSLHVPGKTLYPGDGLEAKGHEFYGPEVAGPEGCTRVEFFAELRGATTVEYQLPDGDKLSWNALTDGQAPWRTGMEGYPALLAEVLAEARARGTQSATPR